MACLLAITVGGGSVCDGGEANMAAILPQIGDFLF